MFTGIIEEVGRVLSVESCGTGARISVQASRVLEDVSYGDSISTNGVCLTVTEYTDSVFKADVMPETMKRSSLKHLMRGDKVNLERAMSLRDRFGGHMVTGHIDGCGKIISCETDANATWITIGASDGLMKYIVEKGSVALDGVSLTVAAVEADGFKVSIIPATEDETVLLERRIGEKVNIECDIIGKYVERLLGVGQQKKENVITVDSLKEYGFV